MKQFVNILHIYKLSAIQPYIFYQYSVISETLRIELKEVHSTKKGGSDGLGQLR